MAGAEKVTIAELDVSPDVGLNVELADVQLPAEEVDMTVVVALAITSVFVIVVVQDQSLFVVVMLSASTAEGARSATRVAATTVKRMMDRIRSK